MAQDKIIQPYIKHDENASRDGKILRLCLDFRKYAKKMTREELESFVSHGAYAIFWQIIEFMHSDTLFTDDIEVLADNLRVNPEFIRKILNDYGLFKVKDGEYISERLLRDLERQEEKSKKAKDSAKRRWEVTTLLSNFKKAYMEFFEEAPVLKSEEIEALKKYSETVPDFKDKLRDIVYTLKNLQFSRDINFNPCANWLLKGNNLARLLNGEFGKLQHKKTPEEEAKEEKEAKAKEEEFNKPSPEEEACMRAQTKEEVLEIISKNARLVGRKPLFLPSLKKYAEQYGITDDEIRERLKENGKKA